MIFLPVFLGFQVIGKDARKTTARRLWCILIHSRKYAHIAGRRAELTQGHPALVPRCVQVVRQTADLASKTAQDGPKILQLGLQDDEEPPKTLQDGSKTFHEPPRPSKGINGVSVRQHEQKTKPLV